jgi:uncharacterized protein (UPF0332 family)
MDKAIIAKTVADEVAAATDCMVAAMNGLAGPYGKAYGRCVSDLYYACFHLASALLASRGIEARSHEAVQKLLALHFVKPAALPQETTARLNELMDKRHVADYKPYIPIGPEDIVALRPWISGFVRNVLRLLEKRAPAAEVESLQRLVNQFGATPLE